MQRASQAADQSIRLSAPAAPLRRNLTSAQAASYLAIGRTKFWELAQAGAIPGRQVLPGPRGVRWAIEDLEAYNDAVRFKDAREHQIKFGNGRNRQ